MSAGLAEAYLSEAPFMCSLQVIYSGRLLALTTNLRLGWKGFPGANALARYEKV
jgi:hypothetical protein